MKLSKSSNFISISVYLYLIIFLFLLSYTFYRAEIIHESNQFSYYYKYYLIFVFGTVFWFTVSLLNNKRKFQIIIIFTSILFILYFYETLRFYEPIINKLSLVKIIKENPEKSKSKEKSKQDIIQELKNNDGIDAVPSIFPKALFKKQWINLETNIYPLGGISNKTTVFCKEGEEYSIYKSDRYGFNNPDREWDSEQIDWFLLGDSFTQGSCVQPGEDIASQIRLFSDQSAISLGMSGNGPLIELASLKEYSYKKKPKIVLWLYFERNDLEDLAKEKSNPVFINYLKENFNQNLYFRQREIDKKLNKYIKLVEQDLQNENLIKKETSEKFLSFKKIIRLKILRDKLALDRGLDFGIDPLFKKIFINAKDFISSWDGRLYFIYLPEKERYTKKNIKHEKYLKKSQVIKIIDKLNIPIIDIHKEFFMKQADPLDFFAYRIYGHYNPVGYKKISEIIVKEVKSNLN